jgi:hypothetical protein
MKSTVMFTTRDDGYGNNRGEGLENRCIYSINAAITSFDEVICVDWGSLEQPLLVRLKDKISHTGKLRIIKISHKWVTDHFNVPQVLDIISKNIAIRRATGEILISTMTDNILPRFNLIEERMIKGENFYLIPRRELPIQVCESHTWGDFDSDKLFVSELVRTQYRYHQIHQQPGDAIIIYVCPGDCQIAHKKSWVDVGGFEESLLAGQHQDSNLQKKFYLRGYSINAITDLPAFHMSHTHHPSIVETWATSYANFTHSTNTENWGYPNEVFEEIII